MAEQVLGLHPTPCKRVSGAAWRTRLDGDLDALRAVLDQLHGAAQPHVQAAGHGGEQAAIAGGHHAVRPAEAAVLLVLRPPTHASVHGLGFSGPIP